MASRTVPVTFAALAWALGVTSPALAAVAGDQPAEEQATRTTEASDGTGLEEIVVTAQRRAEPLQKVPIAVTALSGSQALNSGVNDTQALAAAVPNLAIGQNAVQANIYLRGVGSSASGPGSETSVGVYVDGVYIASPVGNIFSFNNIERVEVLKGPQGTLFGRNATAGVIQIITKTPQQEPHLEMSAGYANYNTVTANLYATRGLGENLAMDLAVDFRDQGDGWGRNITTGADSYFSNYVSLRSKLLFTPSPDTMITIAGDYTHNNNSGTEYAIPEGHVGLDGTSTYAGRYTQQGEFPNRLRADIGGASLRVEQQLGFAQLVSTTSYRKLKQIFSADVDDTPIPIINGTLDQRSHAWTQELQLLAPSDAKVDWVLGGFYFNFVAGSLPQHLTGLAFTALGGQLDIYSQQKVESFAGYGQATVEVVPDTKVTAGLRYTKDKVSFNGRLGLVSGLLPVFTDSVSYGKLTWRLAVSHEFTPQVNGYMSYNRGMKSGGYDLAGVGAPAFLPEQLDSYEVGLKSELFGRRLRLNVAGFYYDYKNIQVQQTINGTAVTKNAAAARLYGIDIDLQASPARNLTITAGVGIVKSKFTDYKDALFYGPNGEVSNLPATGKKVPYAVPFTGSLTAEYLIPTSVGDFTLNGAVIYNDKNYVAASNRFFTPAYTLVNASLGWTSANSGFGIRLWAKNLFDERFYANRQETGGGDLQLDGSPRTYGVTASVKF